MPKTKNEKKSEMKNKAISDFCVELKAKLIKIKTDRAGIMIAKPFKGKMPPVPAPTSSSLTDEECLYRVHKELCNDYPSIQRKHLFRCWFCLAEQEAYQRGLSAPRTYSKEDVFKLAKHFYEIDEHIDAPDYGTYENYLKSFIGTAGEGQKNCWMENAEYILSLLSLKSEADVRDDERTRQMHLLAGMDTRSDIEKQAISDFCERLLKMKSIEEIGIAIKEARLVE